MNYKNLIEMPHHLTTLAALTLSCLTQTLLAHDATGYKQHVNVNCIKLDPLPEYPQPKTQNSYLQYINKIIEQDVEKRVQENRKKKNKAKAQKSPGNTGNVDQNHDAYKQYNAHHSPLSTSLSSNLCGNCSDDFWYGYHNRPGNNINVNQSTNMRKNADQYSDAVNISNDLYNTHEECWYGDGDQKREKQRLKKDDNEQKDDKTNGYTHRIHKMFEQEEKALKGYRQRLAEKAKKQHGERFVNDVLLSDANPIERFLASNNSASKDMDLFFKQIEEEQCHYVKITKERTRNKQIKEQRKLEREQEIFRDESSVMVALDPKNFLHSLGCISRFITRYGVDYKMSNFYNHTLLEHAALIGNSIAVEFLFARGAQIGEHTIRQSICSHDLRTVWVCARTKFSRSCKKLFGWFRSTATDIYESLL